MTEVATMVESAWRVGVGPDDRVRLSGVLARSSDPEVADDPALSELRMFAAWYELLADVRVELPAAPPGAAAGVAGRALSGRRSRRAGSIRRP